MGLQKQCTQILGLRDYRVTAVILEASEPPGQLTLCLERRGVRRYACSGCGRRTSRVRDATDRTWDDLPWAEQRVTLRFHVRRVR